MGIYLKEVKGEVCEYSKRSSWYWWTFKRTMSIYSLSVHVGMCVYKCTYTCVSEDNLLESIISFDPM